MGNQVGVCREPPQLAELFPLPLHGALHHGLEPAEDAGFRSYIHMWRFYSESGEEPILNSPVKLGAFKRFDNKDCYIALHIFKNYTDKQHPAYAVSSHDTPTSSLHDLVISSIEALTPRGIASSFGTLNLEPFISRTTREDYTHDLYVWNGTKSSSLAKAVALAKGFEIDRVLVKEKNNLYPHFARGAKYPLSSIFKDDCEETKGGTANGDMRRYDANHLFRQLINPHKRPSTIKIGELFQNDHLPRYDVFGKSLRKFEPGTSHPPLRTDASKPKVPVLPLHALSPLSSQQQQAQPTQRPEDTPRPKVPPLFVKAATEGSLTLPSHYARSNSSFEMRDPSELNEEDYSKMDNSKLLLIFEPLLSKILDFLYLSSRIPTSDKELLRRCGITHILNCAGDHCRNHFEGDFQYKTYYISDSVQEDLTCLFYETLDFIEEARQQGGKVLVHCSQGVSRSASLVMLYLMWQFRWNFLQANEWVKQIRFIVNPNPGFTGRLMLWHSMYIKLPARTRAHSLPPPTQPPTQPPATYNGGWTIPLATPRNSSRNSPRNSPLTTPRGPRGPLSDAPESIASAFDPPTSSPSITFSPEDPTPTPRGERSATLPTSKVPPLLFSRLTPSPSEPSNTPTIPTLILPHHQPNSLTRTASDPTPTSTQVPFALPVKFYRMAFHSHHAFVVPKGSKYEQLNTTAPPPPTFNSLDPRGCFALCTPACVFLWIGVRCTQQLVDGARRAIDKLQRYEFASTCVVDVYQGHEPSPFWEYFAGGAGEVSENNEYYDYTLPIPS